MTQQDNYDAVEDRTLPAVAYALYLLGLATFGFTAIAGVILAYVSRAPAGPQPRSHYTFLIRTFWIGLAWTFGWGCLFAISIPLSMILIGIPLLLLSKLMLSLGVLWYGARCVVGVVFLAQGQAYPRPESWLI
jgi:uncharacterized membrane protein